jgi:hypothetical protein
VDKSQKELSVRACHDHAVSLESLYLRRDTPIPQHISNSNLSACTVTQVTMAEKSVTPTPELYKRWEPLFKYWKLTVVTEDEYDPWKDPEEARNKYLEAFSLKLDDYERGLLADTLKIWPGVHTRLDHPSKPGLIIFFVRIATKWRISRAEVKDQVYNGNKKPVEKYWKAEEEYLVKRKKKEKEEERGESSKSGSGSTSGTGQSEAS